MNLFHKNYKERFRRRLTSSSQVLLISNSEPCFYQDLCRLSYNCTIVNNNKLETLNINEYLTKNLYNHIIISEEAIVNHSVTALMIIALEFGIYLSICNMKGFENQKYLFNFISDIELKNTLIKESYV